VGAVHAIDIEFSLIEALERSLQEEGLAVTSTGDKEEDRGRKKKTEGDRRQW
jgi:hypothetical protein